MFTVRQPQTDRDKSDRRPLANRGLRHICRLWTVTDVDYGKRENS
jgi:hypothetical protein